MASLAAFVTDFASRIEGTAIWRGAVPRDMALLCLVMYLQRPQTKSYQLSACVALHGLGLAVTCIMIWPTALVACCSPVVADHSSSKATTIPAAGSTSATSVGLGIGVGAIASQVADLATSVAATACSTTVET